MDSDVNMARLKLLKADAPQLCNEEKQAERKEIARKR